MLIMVVEDDEDYAEMVSEILRRESHEVVCAARTVVAHAAIAAHKLVRTMVVIQPPARRVCNAEDVDRDLDCKKAEPRANARRIRFPS